MKKWNYIEADLAIKAENGLSKDARQVPVIAFVNEKTGEIRLFVTKAVRVNGYKKIEKLLNKV